MKKKRRRERGERESEIEKKEKREEKKKKIYLSILCYSMLYIPILNVAGCKKFLGIHTQMKLIFMGLVCIIATGG